MFKMVHQGVNKCLSNTAVIEIYTMGHDMVKDYHETVMCNANVKTKIPASPKVRLNDRNIVDVQKSILKVSYFHLNTVFNACKNGIQTKVTFRKMFSFLVIL